MKQNQKKSNDNSIIWDHKIFKVYKDDIDIKKLENDFFSDDINHIFVDDIKNEYEMLTFDGWKYSFGFTLDNNSFCLIYNKPIDEKL
ncbi:MAG: hypothetical protein U9R41_05025 [Candidatus Marinimicrobia bacterium]|nr:hypothetical protein [Candidatus Neomarinimicrobiota bacterium]